MLKLSVALGFLCYTALCFAQTATPPAKVSPKPAPKPELLAPTEEGATDKAVVAPKQLWIDAFDTKLPPGATAESMGWQGGNDKDGKSDHAMVTENGKTFLRNTYINGIEAKYIYKEFEWDAEQYPYLKWKWRVRKFPKGAKVLSEDKSDAGAQVYVLWKSFPNHYVIKYFWSADEAVGSAFRQSKALFGKLYGVIVRSGGKTGEWQSESRNVFDDFQKAFKDKPPGKVRGIAVLSDGDETKSDAEADFGDFQASKTP